MEEAAAGSTGVDLEVLRAGVRLMALRALGDLDAADEVAQETLTRALVALRNLTPDKLGAYVTGIARHVIADIGRLRQRTVSLESTAADSLREAAADPLESLCSAAERLRVRKALESLPPEDRKLLRLCFFEGKSPTQIAEQIGAPAERVRQRKHRALARLREAFDAGSSPGHDPRASATISGSATGSADARGRRLG